MVRNFTSSGNPRTCGRTVINGLILACALVHTASTQAQETFTPRQARIVGGTTINITQAPSTVALLSASRYAQTGGNARASQFCGGTVIAEMWVLTAAHCVLIQQDDGSFVQTPASEVLVLAGSTDLTQPVTQPVGVSQVIPHPDYQSVIFGSDMALLNLSASTGAPIIPLDNEPVVLNDIGITAGWGALSEAVDGQSQPVPNSLQAVEVFMVPADQCDQLFPQQMAFSGTAISADQICAGREGGGFDSCQGDSGGPLYRKGADDSPQSLVGVVSYGNGCARADFPGIYAGVRLQQSFINGTINNAPGSNPTTNPDNPSNPGSPDEELLSLFPDESGCTVGRGRDPMLPALLLLSSLFLWRRSARRKQTITAAAR